MNGDTCERGGRAQQKKSTGFLRLAVKLGILSMICLILFRFVFGIYVCRGNSMYPSLRDGDLCITFRLEEYIKGDVCAVRRGDKIGFGRIVATGGDVVNISEEGYTINGMEPSEEVLYPTTADTGTISMPYTVPAGTVFLLHDFRSDAGDGRYYGAEEDLQGKVIFVLRRRGF